MKLLDRLRSRFALRAYLIGLAQFAVVTAGFLAYARLNRPDFEALEAEENALAARILTLLDQPDALQHALERAEEKIGATVTVSDPDGRVLASTAPPDAAPCLRPRPLPNHDEPGATGTAETERGGHRRRTDEAEAGRPKTTERDAEIRRPRFRCRIAFVEFPSGRFGRIEFRPTKRPGPPVLFGPMLIALVLIVVGVSSILLARSIVHPLERLSESARALGRGDLEARSGVERPDEIGQVARSFDEMAARVRDLLRAERELVANVSHELRTPLARIRVALDIAAEGDAETARESLADITGGLDELERLVSDILTAARLDIGSPASTQGIPPLRREVLDARELVERAAAHFYGAHPDRELSVQTTGELGAIDGDPVLLRRVLDNVLDNAHKYTGAPDAAVTLGARREDEELVVEVTDRGVGIASEDLEHVFEPFFRADRSRARKTGGHGLGLALVKRIVDAHGGSIALDSTPGEGTRVEIRLPATTAAPD